MYNLLSAISISIAKSVYIFIRTFNTNDAFVEFIESMSHHNIFYVKFIQSLGTNTRYVDNYKREYLSKYLDSVPYKECDIDKSFINSLNEIGCNNDLKIDINSLDIINSGIIGIVYKGKMNDKDIIVKVMKKNIENDVRSAIKDFEMLLCIAKYIPIIKYYYLEDIFSSNKPLLLEQLDFIKEVDNIKQFQKNNKNTDYIKIPDVYEEFTQINKNIIVMEYLIGKKMSQLTLDEKLCNNDLVIKFGIKSILFNRTYHADLHPGNIIFMTNENKLGIIDFGIVGELTKNEQNEIFKFFNYAFVDKNYNNCAKIIIELLSVKINDSYISEKHTLNCYNNIATLLNQIMNNSTALDPEGLFKLNKELYNINKKLSQSFCKVEMSIAIADSVSSNLSKHCNYFDAVSKITNKLLERTF